MIESVREFSHWYTGKVLLVTYYNLEGEQINKQTVYRGTRNESEAIMQDLDFDPTLLGEYRSVKVCLKKNKAKILLAYKEREYADGMQVVDLADSMKNAYFWSGINGNSRNRDYYNRRNSASATWTEGGVTWSASFKTVATRRNIYTYRDYYRGEEKTNLKAVRNSLARLRVEIDKMKQNLI